jgi:hypothetical protein
MFHRLSIVSWQRNTGKTMEQKKTASRDLVVRLLRKALGLHASVAFADSGYADDLVIRQSDGRMVHLQVKSVEDPQGSTQESPTDLVVLRRGTKRLHDELRRAARNFVDLNGTVHLTLPTIMVDRTNLRVPQTQQLIYKRFDPFSDRGSVVVRTLLEASSEDRVWGVRELAGAAGVSPATASRVLRELENRGVAVQRRGRTAAVRLTEANALFLAWTQAYDWTRNTSLAFNAPVGDAARFLTRTAKTWRGPRWALTLHAGASRIAPLATWDRVHIYVDVPDASGLEHAGEEQGWEPAEQGNVVLMKPYYKTSVWHGMDVIGGVPVVSPLQLALDLWHYPLRGREQAEHLLGAVAEIHL